MNKRYFDLDLSLYFDERNTPVEDNHSICRIDTYDNYTVENIRVKARRTGPTRWTSEGSQLYIHDDCWIDINDSYAKISAGEVLRFNWAVPVIIWNRNLILPVKCTLIQKRNGVY